MAAALSVVSASAIARDVTLTWDPSTTPEIGGYDVHWGPASGDYPYTIDVGNTTTYTLTALDPAEDYYITVTTYDPTGSYESDFSNEVFVIGSGTDGSTTDDSTATTDDSTATTDDSTATTDDSTTTTDGSTTTTDGSTTTTDGSGSGGSSSGGSGSGGSGSGGSSTGGSSTDGSSTDGSTADGSSGDGSSTDGSGTGGYYGSVEDTTPPYVTVSSPEPGSTVNGNITLAAFATDDIGATEIVISVNDEVQCAGSSYATCDWHAGKAGAGNHTISATARDAAGNVGAHAVTVTVPEKGKGNGKPKK